VGDFLVRKILIAILDIIKQGKRSKVIPVIVAYHWKWRSKMYWVKEILDSNYKQMLQNSFPQWRKMGAFFSINKQHSGPIAQGIL